MVNIPKNYVSDWEQGHGSEWAEISPYLDSDTTNYNPNPPQPVFVNGEWVARYSNASNYGKIQTMPRFVLSTTTGFDIEVPITLNALTPNVNGGYYLAVALYNGEASYFGAYFQLNYSNEGLVYVHNCGYGAFEEDAESLAMEKTSRGWWTRGDKVFVKIVCDETLGETRLYIRNETQDPGGNYALIHTRYHEVMQATDSRIEGLSGSATQATFKWLDAASLWISGSSFSDSNMTQPWNVDLHPISINQHGDSIVLGGAGAWYPWTNYWNELPSGFNNQNPANALMESKEAVAEPEGLIGGSFTEPEPYYGNIDPGTYVYTSELIDRAGFRPDKVRLYGRETAPEGSGVTDGVCKIELLDSSDQVLSIDSVQEWHPEGGVFTPLELTLPMVAGIKLRATLTQNHTFQDLIHSGGWNFLNITPILFGFVVTGTGIPQSSPAPGAYWPSTDVTLSAPEGADIYYNTGDGTQSDPTTASTPYTVPISIAETTTIMFLYVLDGYTSPVQTAEYVIPSPSPTGIRRGETPIRLAGRRIVR